MRAAGRSRASSLESALVLRGAHPSRVGGGCALSYNRMVVDGLTDGEVDRLFHALADGTRRDILRRCIGGEPSVSRLADVYPMSFAAVQKHVAVLARAGLVTKERRGREQLVHTDGDAVGRARRVLDELETAWRGRVERMADLLAQVPQPERNTPSTGRGG
jgi:DNA-binding transcriptional ArsR family regulator